MATNAAQEFLLAKKSCALAVVFENLGHSLSNVM
jgi:hypothetical protein